MPISIQALAAKAVGTSIPKSVFNDTVIGIVCVCLFLVFNPFLALFFVVALSVFFRVPPSVFLVSASLSLSLFFFFREYGVAFALGATDDVPTYIALYQENDVVSFLGIFTRFFETPPGYEPLWQLPWWFMLHLFGASEDTFVFSHYLLMFSALFFSFYVLSKRYFVALALVYFFATPISFDSLIHIFRQQLAFSLFLTGIGFYFVKGRAIGKWLIYLSPFMHLSMMFFVAVFLAFELYRKYVGLDSTLKFLLIAIANLAAIRLIAPFAVNLLDAYGLPSVVSYLEGTGEDQTNVFVSISIYSGLLFLAHFKLKTDDVNTLFVVLLFSVFGVMLAFPGATGIYIRLLMFVFPLYGIYFFRCYLMNFSTRWLLPVVSLVFLSGAIRIYRTVSGDDGVVRFLAFGHPFDPFMGALKMLISFGTA